MAGFWNQQKKPYFIAEIGVNHNGDLALAKEMVDAAIACGADAVKFQSFSADTVSCKKSLSAPHVDKSLGIEGTFYTLLEKLSLTHVAQKEIQAYCIEKGIPFISTPFSFQDIDFLVSLNVPFLKIGSTDTTHLAFLEYAAKTGKPLVVSTGMATLEETKAAVQTILNTGNKDLALLHCVSLYPPNPEELQLRSISVFKETFPELTIGFSDHSIGAWASLGAIALGATIIEKHFTLDKHMPGPDQSVSADPKEMRQIIEEGTLVYQALGSAYKTPSNREASMKTAFLRSIVSKRALPKGTILKKEDLDFKRPGTGISPNDLSHILGKETLIDIPADTPLEYSMITQEGTVPTHV